MKAIHAGLAFAASAVLAAPVFAQSLVCDTANNLCAPSTAILGAGPVTSSSGAAITSGTGVVVTPGVPSAIAVAPSSNVAAVLPSGQLLPGGTMVQSSTTVLGGPPAVVTGPASTTVVTRYWVNVPAGVESRADFQRWMHLR